MKTPDTDNVCYYLTGMQQDLTSIESSLLVDMLIKDTEYYRHLCETENNSPQRKTVVQHIDLIIAELKSRKEYQEVRNDEDMNTMTAE
ncbi:MAG: hypothetical protein ABIN74_00145 [Ferruginibacter sp.]